MKIFSAVLLFAANTLNSTQPKSNLAFGVPAAIITSVRYC